MISCHKSYYGLPVICESLHINEGVKIKKEEFYVFYDRAQELTIRSSTKERNPALRTPISGLGTLLPKNWILVLRYNHVDNPAATP